MAQIPRTATPDLVRFARGLGIRVETEGLSEPAPPAQGQAAKPPPKRKGRNPVEKS